jgi:Leucine-rich repeat (LRR) protein
MANTWYEYLKKWLSFSDADLLRTAGLLDPRVFHCREPINQYIADLLVKLPTLKVFQFHDVKPGRKTLDVLNDVFFQKRKDVTLRVYGYPDTWADISFLEYLPEVERFDWHTAVFGPTASLHQMKRLVHLGLGDTQPKPKISLNFVKDFSNTLESLSIEGDYKDTLTAIPELRKLKTVWFTSTKLTGFDFLEGLDIETLRNYGGRVGSFEFLRKLSSLKRVWIKTNPTLENIDFIEDLRNLQRLELYYVSKLTRFPKCEHLKDLELIFASECNRLIDISEIKKLRGVKIYVGGKSLKGRNYSTPDFTLP